MQSIVLKISYNLNLAHVVNAICKQRRIQSTSTPKNHFMKKCKHSHTKGNMLLHVGPTACASIRIQKAFTCWFAMCSMCNTHTECYKHMVWWRKRRPYILEHVILVIWCFNDVWNVSLLTMLQNPVWIAKKNWRTLYRGNLQDLLEIAVLPVRLTCCPTQQGTSQVVCFDALTIWRCINLLTIERNKSWAGLCNCLIHHDLWIVWRRWRTWEFLSMKSMWHNVIYPTYFYRRWCVHFARRFSIAMVH